MDEEKSGGVGVELGGILAFALIIAISPIILTSLGESTARFFETYSVYWDMGINALKVIIGVIVGISFPISLFFLIAIIYCVERLKQIRKKEAEIFDLKVEPAYVDMGAESGANRTLANMWERVTTHINSQNQNDWKQAIIEADLILDDLLTKMGYRGESIGEKLKRVEKGDMETLQDAWDAHKVRNQIAHEVGFTLNHVEAKQAIQSYRRVFEEFYYI